MQLLIAFTTAVIFAPEPEQLDRVRCGSFCTFIGLRALSLGSASYADFERSLGQPSKLGYSMDQLQQATTAAGAQSLFVQTSAERLEWRAMRNERFACIAHLEPGHYVMIHDVKDGMASIVDPPRSYDVDLPTLSTMWKGKALLISDSPLAQEEDIVGPSRGVWRLLVAILISAGMGLLLYCCWPTVVRISMRRSQSKSALLLCLLSGGITGCSSGHGGDSAMPTCEVEPADINLGEIDVASESTRVVSFVIRNQGFAPLLIRSVITSCDCISSSLSSNQIPPGGRQELKAKVRLAGPVGLEKTVRIEVTTNAPLHNMVPLEVRWTPIRQLRLSESFWNEGVLKSGGSAKKTIAIMASSSVAAWKWSVNVTSSHSAVSAVVNLTDAGNARKGQIGELDLALNAGHPMAREVNSAFVEVTAKGVSPSQGGQTVVFKIPIDWIVEPPVSASPPLVFFGTVRKGETASNQVVVRSHDNVAFHLTKATLPADALTIDNKVIGGEAKVSHNLTVTLATDKLPVGPVKSTVTFATDHPRCHRLLIEVSAYVAQDSGPK